MTKEGYKFLIPALITAFILFAVWKVTSALVFLPLAVLFVLFSFFFAFFFRDPEREIPQGENLILSSADGKVILVKPFDHLDFLGGKGTIISVFMSVFNVHINRAPVSGQVKFCKYNPGKFLPAFKEKASQENEQTTLGLENERGKIALKQIAGIIARRIVCRAKPGDQLKKGERFGLIQFGSRVDHFLPENVDIKVIPNQKVKAGETVIGVFRN
jgi:phosphatidylserine decarboxylase